MLTQTNNLYILCKNSSESILQIIFYFLLLSIVLMVGPRLSKFQFTIFFKNIYFIISINKILKLSNPSPKSDPTQPRWVRAYFLFWAFGSILIFHGPISNCIWKSNFASYRLKNGSNRPRPPTYVFFWDFLFFLFFILVN